MNFGFRLKTIPGISAATMYFFISFNKIRQTPKLVKEWRIFSAAR